MSFDFDAAVTAPFRMQPGLRPMAADARHLSPLAPGSRHQREKLAVLSAFAEQALCARPGFDAGPALDTLFRLAAQEQPDAWSWDGARAWAPRLGTAVRSGGDIEQVAAGAFGLGDEIARCLLGLPPDWRLAGLAALAYEEDFAIVDGLAGTVPWLMVALPSHWAPETRVGRRFTDIHAPVADNATLLRSAPGLIQLATGSGRWERFVWNVTDHPRLHAHPDRVAPRRWLDTDPAQAWWRTERQTFVPVPAQQQSVFTIRIEVEPLAEAVAMPGRAAALHAAIESMSPAVLAYRNLVTVREPLLAWLAMHA